jgi:chorismate synthase
MKYGPSDDAIGAGIFSGRYTSTIVAGGFAAKKVLQRCGIQVFSYIKEMAGVRCPDIDPARALAATESYKRMRRDYDPFYQEIYIEGRITPEMRLLEKMAVLAQVEQEIDYIRSLAPDFDSDDIREEYGIHPVVNCPDIDAADAMLQAVNRITATGDSSGGVIEVIVCGVPAGLGEPVFTKLDAELGRMLGIGAVKGVEVGAGFRVKDLTGFENNDQMHSEKGAIVFDSNNAGGITGGLSTGQDIVVRLAVKPTPTIDRPQHTVDKYTMENTELAAITRRDPTIVGRIWPVAENYTALILLDHLVMHYGYQALRGKMEQGD